MPGGRSSRARRGRCARARSTWTCRSRSASCWRSAMSVVQTLAHERDAYFDSALMLLMFLLAGRYLDQRMRRRTRDVAINLVGDHAPTGPKARTTMARRARRRSPRSAPATSCSRAPANGSPSTGRRGRAFGDRPEPGDRRDRAGLRRPGRAGLRRRRSTWPARLRIRVRRPPSGTFLDEVNGLLESAVEQRSSYVRLADRAARLYAPVVHAGGARDVPRLACARAPAGSRRCSSRSRC